jgi:hypothetical protein
MGAALELTLLHSSRIPDFASSKSLAKLGPHVRNSGENHSLRSCGAKKGNDVQSFEEF